MGAGLLGPDRVINPVQQQLQFYETVSIQFTLAAPANIRRRRSRGFFPLPIRQRKFYQAGIDGVGEHCSKYCVPESERR